MRRNPGVVGPNRHVYALRHALVPDPFLASEFQWAHVAAVHGGFSTTLTSAARIGDGVVVATPGTTVAPTGSALQVTTTALPSGAEYQAYSGTLEAANGTPPYSWSLDSGALPTGLSLSSAGVISGTPTGGYASFVVKVTDAASNTATGSPALPIDVPLHVSAVPAVDDYLQLGAFSTTLSSPAAQGATSIELAAAPPFVTGQGGPPLIVGLWGQPYTVTSVSGSGPYTVGLASGLLAAQASGTPVVAQAALARVVSVDSVNKAAWLALELPYGLAVGATVKALNTVDVYPDGSAGMLQSDGTPDPAFLVPGNAYLSGYSPVVGDYVLMTRKNYSTGNSDRFVLGKQA